MHATHQASVLGPTNKYAILNFDYVWWAEFEFSPLTIIGFLYSENVHEIYKYLASSCHFTDAKLINFN